MPPVGVEVGSPLFSPRGCGIAAHSATLAVLVDKAEGAKGVEWFGVGRFTWLVGWLGGVGWLDVDWLVGGRLLASGLVGWWLVGWLEVVGLWVGLLLVGWYWRLVGWLVG